MTTLIVDGNSILNRAFYGVKPLANHKGVFTNAIFGFFNIVLRAVSDTKAERVIVAFDRKEPTFRHKASAAYKANRKGMPEELVMQLPYTKDICGYLGWPVVTCAGWEADDVLGTLAKACSDLDETCVLLSGDRDNLQLISDCVTVRLATNKEPIMYDSARFSEEYGFAPISLIDLKALMGDSSDNIKGVSGIGEKTAMALIQKYGTIEKLYEALPDDETVKPAARKKLEAGIADAKESKFLATIVTDAPISMNLRDYDTQERDDTALSNVLTELEMHKLMERLHVEAAAVTVPESADDSEAYEAEIVPMNETVFAEICACEEPVDFLYHDRILYAAWHQKITRITDFSRILDFLSGKTPKRTFDAKPVYRMMMTEKRQLLGLISDGIICAYLLNPSTTEYRIDRLCGDFGIAYDKEKGEFADIFSLAPLSDKLLKQVDDEGMGQLLREVEIPLVEVLADMEHTGVLVDSDGVRVFGEKLASQITDLQAKIYAEAGHEFNILSPKQLGTVLFDEMQLPAGKKTKTGWSTNAEVLEGLRDKSPLVEDVLQYRQLTKLQSTYVEGLLSAVAPDGRIHTCYRQTETRTGRLSSTEPNLQNIPVRTPLGAEMRKFFVASEGCVLLDADYSQIELRLVAHLTGDENMRNSFIEERDIHRTTAAQVFNMPEEMVTKEMRSAAKAVNFGILYGIGAFSLSKDIGVSVAKADRYIRDYLSSFPCVERFMNDTVNNAKENGYVTTMFGRRRYVPELRAANKQVQAAGRRIAMNTPVQGTAADIIKAAMVKVWRRLRDEVPEAKLILQIHDELIVEAPLSVADRAAEILHTEMEHACELSVPLTADVQKGGSWYDAKG